MKESQKERYPMRIVSTTTPDYDKKGFLNSREYIFECELWELAWLSTVLKMKILHLPEGRNKFARIVTHLK